MKSRLVFAAVGLVALGITADAAASQINVNGNIFHAYFAVDNPYIEYYAQGVYTTKNSSQANVIASLPHNTGSGQKIVIYGWQAAPPPGGAIATICSVYSTDSSGNILWGWNGAATAVGNWTLTTPSMPSSGSTSTSHLSVYCSIPGRQMGIIYEIIVK